MTQGMSKMAMTGHGSTHVLTLPPGGGLIIDVVSDGSMSIGNFSRASFLSVKALRAYHEGGLLVPARVDPATGYRIYHAAQLIDAAVIHRLRSLDLPLKQIREILDARDPAVTAKILDEHRRAKESELDAITRIVSQLQADADVPAAHTPVHERDEPHQHTLAFRGAARLDEFSAFLGHAYATLGEVLVSSLAVPTGAAGALYANELATTDPRRSRRTSRSSRR